MEARPSFGIEIDVCTRCGGVFLDGGEAEVQGVDTALLFGAYAADVGLGSRLCPAHALPMRRYRIQGARGPVDIERAECCGGVFLDPGEQGALAQAAAHASRLAGAARWRLPPAASPDPSGAVTTDTGAVFALPPEHGGALGGVLRGALSSAGAPAAPPAELDPSEATGRHCPRCRNPYRADRAGGVEIDVCDGCGSIFFDLGELASRHIDTAALFGQGPEAAQHAGPSELACPACHTPMEVLRVTTLAGVLEVDRAACCGGLFLDGGEEDAFARAARVANQDAAERQFLRDGAVAGEVQINQAIATASSVDDATAAFVRGRMDSALTHILRRRIRRDRRWL